MFVVLSGRSLRRADHSSRGVLPTVVRRRVWSRKPQKWKGHDPRWVAAPQHKKKLYISLKRAFVRTMKSAFFWLYNALGNTAQNVRHTYIHVWKWVIAIRGL
jgi:hypothetical protein